MRIETRYYKCGCSRKNKNDEINTGQMPRQREGERYRQEKQLKKNEET